MTRFITSSWVALLLRTVALQAGCVHAATDAAGAAIGHEVAEREQERDDDE